jgi:hypothetical protein
VLHREHGGRGTRRDSDLVVDLLYVVGGRLRRDRQVLRHFLVCFALPSAVQPLSIPSWDRFARCTHLGQTSLRRWVPRTSIHGKPDKRSGIRFQPEGLGLSPDREGERHISPLDEKARKGLLAFLCGNNADSGPLVINQIRQTKDKEGAEVVHG